MQLTDYLVVVVAIVGVPLAFVAYISIIKYLPLLKKASPILDAINNNPSLLSGDTSAISAALEKELPVVLTNTFTDMVENGVFDGLVERYGEDIVVLGQTIGQNIAATTFQALKDKVTGQAGGIQKGVNYEAKRQQDAMFAAAVGSEELAEAVDEFADEFGIPVGLARQFAPAVLSWAQNKFGGLVSGLPSPQGGGNSPRSDISGWM